MITLLVVITVSLMVMMVMMMIVVVIDGDDDSGSDSDKVYMNVLSQHCKKQQTNDVLECFTSTASCKIVHTFWGISIISALKLRILDTWIANSQIETRKGLGLGVGEGTPSMKVHPPPRQRNCRILRFCTDQARVDSTDTILLSQYIVHWN